MTLKYEKKLWIDRITDEQGNVIEPGTPLSAGNMNNIEEGIHALAVNQSVQETQTDVLEHGTSVITSDMPGPLTAQFKGNSLANYISNFNLWDLHANVNLIDNKTMELVASIAGETSERVIDVKAGEYYVIQQDITNDGRLVVDVQDVSGVQIERKFDETVTGKFVGKITINVDGAKLRIVNTALSSGTFTFSEPSLYKISQANYDAIGITILDADIERLFPYGNSVQHVRNPVMAVDGVNLYEPIYKEMNPSIYEGYIQLAKYFIYSQRSSYPGNLSFKDNDLLVKGGIHYFYFNNLLPNTKYTYSFIFIGDATAGEFYKFLGITRIPASSIGQRVYRTITTDASGGISQQTLYETSTTYGWNGTNTVEALDIQIELGETITPYVDYNPSYLYAETVLAGNDSVQDLLFDINYEIGKAKKLKAIEADKVMDGSLGWQMVSDYTGYKSFKVIGLSSGTNKGEIVKYDGSILSFVNSAYDKADKSDMVSSNGVLIITVSDTGTGFLETMTMSSDLIKAYFNGWKYTGDGTTHSWVSIVDGGAPPTATLVYVSTTMAAGFTPYELTYQLAKAVVETDIRVEGDLSIQGDAQVSISEGVIVREVANPQLYTTLYRINDIQVSGSKLVHKAKKIMGVFKDGNPDYGWQVVSDPSAYGNQRAVIDPSFFDAAATYTVTYELLDKYDFTTNIQIVLATFQKSMKSAFQQTVSKQSDIATTVSVHDRQILDMMIRLDAGGL